MISGAKNNYDLILRTGAWGRDIVVPAAIAGVLTLGVAATSSGCGIGSGHMHLKKFLGLYKEDDI